MSMRSDEHARGTPPGLTQSYIWLVPAVYALFGVIWILFTDKLVASLATNEAQLVTMQLWKGWLYVLLTTLLLLVLLRIGAAWEQAYIRSLRTSERKYRQLVETMQEGFGIQDAEMNITYVNEAFCRMMGCSSSELVSRSVLDFLDEANRQVMREETEKRKRGILGAYDLEWIAHDGRSVATLVSPAPMHGDDGELVGTFATLADITERIRSEQALRESEEKFRTLAEQTLLGLNIFREEEVLYVNDAFCQIYGAVKDEIVGQPLTSLVDTVHPDDRPWVHDLGRRRLAGEPGVPGEYEYRIVTPAGEVKWLHAFVKSITLEGKRATMHTVVDITAQKAAEEAFHAEKERAQMYLNLAPVMFVAVDRTGRITLVNDKACEVLDRDRKDIAGKRWFENFVPPQARERVQSVFDKLMAGRVEAASVFVNPVLTSSGEEKMIEWRNTVFRDEAGRPAGTLSAGVDITERREMEWALRESESRFRSLFGTMTEGVAIHEAVRNETGDITDFFIKDVNPAFEQLIGLKRQQLVGAKASEVYGAELRSHFRECATVAERGRPARFEARTKAPERYFDVKCFAPRKGWFAAVIDDVTEVRLAQVALWQEKDLVSRIMETSPAGITLVNKQGQLTFANTAAEKVLGLSASKIVERVYNDPEWRITDYEGRPFFDNHLPFARVMATGQPVSGVKHAIEWPNGRRTLLVINASPLRSVSGDMEGMVAVVEDVTNAVKVQQELKESEERMQSILRASPVGIGLTKNRVFQWTNEFLSRMLGYTAAELEGQSARMVYESDEEFVHVGEVKYAQIEAWGIGNIETRLRCKDGSVIDVLLSSTYLNPGSPEGGVIFTAMDVTDRKAVERALGESERAMSTLLSNLPGVVYRCRNDRDWTMEFISDGITALTGYEPADVIENQRLSYNDLIHPDDRERIWNEVSPTIEAGEPFTLEYRIVTREGAVKHVWEQGRAVRNQEGKVESLEGYIVDVTERKQAEDALIESRHLLRELTQSVMNAQEEERARISREIHDELAQMLTALRIDLSSIVRRVPQEMDDLLKRTKVMDEHISTTVDVVRRISAELRPSVLDNLGLAAAVEWQVNEFKKRTGADARLRVQPKELELDEGRSVAVFRILQEALTNVARHADATRADVSLTLGRGKLRLRVRDNGKGMAAGKPDPTKALGIAGMRERARLWGGSVRIESAVNEGTAVVLEMPYPAKIPDRGDDVEDTHRGRPRSRPAGAKADTRRKTRGRQDR